MTLREQGLTRGREAGAGIGKDYPITVQSALRQWRTLYPTMREDLGQALIACDHRRLASRPDLTRFPELRGHDDYLRAEREGFAQTSGLDELSTAHFFSGWYFHTKWLETHHLGRWDILTSTGCTNIFIPDGRDGVTVADNRDIGLLDDMSGLAKWRPEFLFTQNKDGVGWSQGAVSSAVVLDDEPGCSYPADPFHYAHLVPPEFYDNLDVMIEFLGRFNEFWGPCNKILVDRKLNALMLEKTNCLMGWRKAGSSGAAAVTACAYLDPKLHEHQLERSRRAAALKGETEADSLEINYHKGSRQRYHRLTALTEAAARGKPDIWEALAVVADHEVPYPDRVCLAGESLRSTERNPHENWSVTQHAAVITGPRRRALYRTIQSRSEPKPVYEYTPKLLLWPGVAMRPEWQAEVDAGRCVLAPVA